MKLKKILALALAVIMVLALAACGSSKPATSDAPKTEAPKTEAPKTEAPKAEAPKNTPPVAESADSGKYGGVLKVAVNHDIVNLGVPQKNLTFQAALVVDCCLEHLCRYNPDATLDPWLIEGYEEDPDAQTLTVNIKKGIKFHDGSDLNADAVIFNWELWTSEGNAELKNATYDKKDDYTVVVHMDPWSNSIATTCLYTAGTMISKALVESKGVDYANEHPCGTGPFVFKEWNRDVNVVFEANKNYWIEGLPYLDGIEFKIIMDPAGLANAFIAKEVDVVYQPTPDTSMTIKSAGYQSVTKPLVSGASAAITWFCCNDDGPMGDVNVRRAICSAVNMDAIWAACAAQTGGIYDRIIQWGPNNVWSANPETKGYPYSVEAAKDYLAKTDWPNGFDMTILYVKNNESDMVAQLMQEDLKKVGINATIEYMDEAKSAEISGVNGENFTGMIISAGRAEVDLGTYYNRTFLPDGVRWVSQVNHYDDIVETLTTAMTCKSFDEKKAACQKLSKMVIDDYCQMFPMWTNNAAAFVQDNVMDHGIYQINMLIWTPETTYFAK